MRTPTARWFSHAVQTILMKQDSAGAHVYELDDLVAVHSLVAWAAAHLDPRVPTDRTFDAVAAGCACSPALVQDLRTLLDMAAPHLLRTEPAPETMRVRELLPPGRTAFPHAPVRRRRRRAPPAFDPRVARAR